jgi:cytochrome c biogenesis protein CcdA
LLSAHAGNLAAIHYRIILVDENVTLVIAFGGGLLSFLSPCVLPMVPVYLASLYGPELFGTGRARLPVFLHSLSFVLGFSVVFIILGAMAGLTGYAVNPDYELLRKVAGGLLIAFGLFIVKNVWRSHWAAPAVICAPASSGRFFPSAGRPVSARYWAAS